MALQLSSGIWIINLFLSAYEFDSCITQQFPCGRLPSFQWPLAAIWYKFKVLLSSAANCCHLHIAVTLNNLDCSKQDIYCLVKLYFSNICLRLLFNIKCGVQTFWNRLRFKFHFHTLILLIVSGFSLSPKYVYICVMNLLFQCSLAHLFWWDCSHWMLQKTSLILFVSW